MRARRIKVMIVEDSPTQSLLLEEIINADPRLQVVAVAGSAEKALRVMARVRPDVVSMDIQLPKMDGYQATRQIMQDYPLPIVVVSSSVGGKDAEISMNSLRAGALAVVKKPPGPGEPEHHTLAARMCEQLVIMSDVRVVRQRGNQPRKRKVPLSRPPVEPVVLRESSLVGIVASTGGPPALVSLLEKLPSDYPHPILIVQHMNEAFLPGFIDWLDGRCALRVKPALDGELPCRGKVYVAPGGYHLEVGPNSLKLNDSHPVSFQCPSGTVLFRSLAREAGPEGVGILLTGMGDDGAEGLLELKRRGGHTIVEDRSTATVYGMPRAAQELGAATEVLPLPDIARRLLELGEEVQL